jgi:predicted nuclease of restriction endonuclease-like (RecB) superfamily
MEPSSQQDFSTVVQLIESAKAHVSRAVNTALIDLYWGVGEYVSQRITSQVWGKSTVAELAAYIQRQQPGLKGFSAQNIWRMRQFYDAYRESPILSTLLRELPWSAHLHILTRAKYPEEREFYLRTATQQHWTVREVARQMDSQLFARSLTQPAKMAPSLTQAHPQAGSYFKDSYYLEFLGLPSPHAEA